MTADGVQRSGEHVSAGGGVEESLYETTQAIGRELADPAWAAYRVGDDAQRGLVDLAFDLANGSIAEARARSSEWLRDAQEGVGTLGSPRSVEAAWRRTSNNVEVYNLVKNRRPQLRFDAAGDVDLGRLIDDAYGLGAYADLWAIEGLGHDYTAYLLSRDGGSGSILRDGPAAGLPASSLTMMHAGLGLALAERLLPRLTPWSPHRQFIAALEEYVGSCDRHGRPGFRGAAYESLGLVARTWHPQLVRGIAEACADIGGGLSGYFWHGAGRALYFLPTYIVAVLSPWRAADREGPDEEARRNLHAGLAWAWTLVNIRQPAILDGLAWSLGDPLHRDAVINGLASAMVVRIDTTANDPHVMTLLTRAPRDTAGAPDAWRAIVHKTLDAALNRFHPILRQQGALDAVFRYGDLSELTDRLDPGLAGRHRSLSTPSARTIPAVHRRGAHPSPPLAPAGNTS